MNMGSPFPHSGSCKIRCRRRTLAGVSGAELLRCTENLKVHKKYLRCRLLGMNQVRSDLTTVRDWMPFGCSPGQALETPIQATSCVFVSAYREVLQVPRGYPRLESSAMRKRQTVEFLGQMGANTSQRPFSRVWTRSVSKIVDASMTRQGTNRLPPRERGADRVCRFRDVAAPRRERIDSRGASTD